MRRTLFSRISTGALISIEGNVALWLWVPHMESGLSLQATSCGLHQGIFSQPGRVVTLVGSENPEEPVWGIAYNIAKEDVDRVVAHLDHREKDGYQKIPVTFHPQDSSIQPWQLIIYLGSETNPFFVGQSDEENIAQIIAYAEGPSGSNKEYLFQLADTMRTLGVFDPHLFNIESRVKKILQI
ncbi:putative glutathione-specific gamma-glutamylcyclotransferase 2 isoform X6 [Portunus trituberculatus]|uniref:putative glutathione-specific gamma-glutamylcyclotransferase 2 isoform X6 n=1 Tax=Portunus trituberculatus TaxID=210409 RepID=UPI001E1CBE57|nr:putative glutathione-specific gamma-glutamylcyclotransferase 2 isoform X6 [Portunus trituberculatus]